MSNIKLTLNEFSESEGGPGEDYHLVLTDDHDDVPEGHKITLEPIDSGYAVGLYDETGSLVGEKGLTSFPAPEGALSTAKDYKALENAIEGAIEIAEEKLEKIANNNLFN